jgi:hypothetical protein
MLQEKKPNAIISDNITRIEILKRYLKIMHIVEESKANTKISK